MNPGLTKGAPEIQAVNLSLQSNFKNVATSHASSIIVGTSLHPRALNYIIRRGDVSSNQQRYLVTLNIFSGLPNPTYSLTKSQIDGLKRILALSVQNIPKAPPALGYRGYRVLSEDLSESFKVLGNPNAESYLTNIIQNMIPKSVTYQVRKEIPKVRTANALVQSALAISAATYATNNRCNMTPIRGTHFTPSFDPSSNNFGCFITKQRYNNCYNYSTDILTNTFAQPGRATGISYLRLTCKDVRQAAESDGLVWLGSTYPNFNVAYGHFVALVIWESNDFHWLRLDKNGYWSHKPGTSPIINYDNNYNLISDPASQNLSPYTFCGYLWLNTSKLNIL